MKRNELTGLWGERSAFHALSQRSDIINVTWVNKTEEQRLPYDITAQTTDAEPRQMYYEVKASASLTTPTVPLSVAEVEAARRFGAAFNFVLVRYDAQHETARVAVLPNWLTSSTTLLLPIRPEQLFED